MKRLIYFLIAFTMGLPINILFAQDGKNEVPENEQSKPKFDLKSDEISTAKLPASQESNLTFDKSIVGEKNKSAKEILKPRMPFTSLFKYDTTPANPEHRCYEITKPISKKYTFLFNFMSLQKYSVKGY